MYYVISDDEGNTLDTFDDEREAELALLAIATEHPAQADEVLLLAYEDDGRAVGPARLLEDIVGRGWIKLTTTATVRSSQVVRLVPTSARDSVTLSAGDAAPTPA